MWDSKERKKYWLELKLHSPDTYAAMQATYRATEAYKLVVKNAVKKWRSMHREQWNEYQRNYARRKYAEKKKMYELQKEKTCY